MTLLHFLDWWLVHRHAFAYTGSTTQRNKGILHAWPECRARFERTIPVFELSKKVRDMLICWIKSSNTNSVNSVWTQHKFKEAFLHYRILWIWYQCRPTQEKRCRWLWGRGVRRELTANEKFLNLNPSLHTLYYNHIYTKVFVTSFNYFSSLTVTQYYKVCADPTKLIGWPRVEDPCFAVCSNSPLISYISTRSYFHELCTDFP
jgi:hypothetical protein